ncbi:hypothetical protein [Gimesia aquarii]|uniref:Uncharacterized protein n=1 Tax=Gimesia aquarii TaxID=2527964 RepID=A0A517W1F7_9PLAN|nr:hypothetical protein [Gimesia aquarii]QDT99091.1 hypothetical protein V144x_46010 [Gimesia aquarii]
MKRVLFLLVSLLIPAFIHAKEYRVTIPPDALKLPKAYTKYVSASGYPVVAFDQVNDYALKEAAWLIDIMLAHRPDIRKAMIESGSRFIVIPCNAFTTDIPEYAHLKPKDYWDVRARGLGGSATDPVCSCGEENLLAFPGDPYAAECILIHEFAHNIHLRGLNQVDPTFDERLEKVYQQAMKAGLWKGKYPSVNRMEYFAEGVQSWFNNNRENDLDHNHVNTREELVAYDPDLAALCKEVFGETKLVYSKPLLRLKDHLEGYDPVKAKHFKWPERLKAAQKKIIEDAKKRNQQSQKLN